MLKSHRLVDNGRGGYDIMSKEMYHRKAEQDALMSVINTPRGGENQALLEQFNKFMDEAKADNKNELNIIYLKLILYLILLKLILMKNNKENI